MSNEVLLIDKEEYDSLGEKVFALSEAGQKEISKKGWQSIGVKDRLKALDIYNALVANKGIIKLTEEKAAKKKVADKTISLEDLSVNIGKLSKEERREVLEKMDDLKATNQKVAREEGFKRLPEDIQATLGMSPENLKKLTEDQRTTLLKQFDGILEVEKEAKKKQVIESMTA